MAPANKNHAILTRWETTLAQRGDEPAVRAADGKTLRSFAAIENEARSLAEELEKFSPGSVLALQIGNHPSWPALLLAAFRQSLIPFPLGGHMEQAERDAALATCGATAIVTADDEGLQFGRTHFPLTAWMGEPPDFLKLTSGTTAAPRAIRFRAAQLVADCDHICDTMGLRADDLNFGVIPFSHSYGFSNLLTPLLCRGVALVASEDRIPRAILDGLACSGATVFPGMPVFFEKLAELSNPSALPRLRLCISAGAPLSMRSAGRFTEKYGLKIHTFYGSSECGGIAYDASDALDGEEDFAGSPMCGVRLAPLDSAAEVSRIAVHSEAVGDGYFPQEDRATLGDGRFIPGDLVRLSPRGLHLAGRAADFINIAGRKLNPAEIEARLASLTGVKQVTVFGVPSRLRHEEAVACVSGAITAGEVLQFARHHLSAWQVPKDIWIVEEIPVNERGKISRRELAQQYLQRVS